MNDVSATALKDRIAEFTSNVSKHTPPQVLATLGEELRKLAESGIATKALHAGAKAPEFSLPDAHGRAVALSSVLAKGPAVVTFYRGGWCPFCDIAGVTEGLWQPHSEIQRRRVAGAAHARKVCSGILATLRPVRS